MFPKRYFVTRYFAPRYFPPVIEAGGTVIWTAMGMYMYLRQSFGFDE